MSPVSGVGGCILRIKDKKISIVTACEVVHSQCKFLPI